MTSWNLSATSSEQHNPAMTQGRGYVYLFYNPATELTKIGHSVDPHNRKKVLETRHGPLDVLAVARADDPPKLERALHLLVEPKRIEGEWFNLQGSVKTLRNALADRLIEWSEAVRTPETTHWLERVDWRLPTLLKQHEVTPYSLHKDVNKLLEPKRTVSPATIYRWARGDVPKTLDTEIFFAVIEVLRGRTGLDLNVSDLLQYRSAETPPPKLEVSNEQPI